MSNKNHWETVFQTKTPEQVSWTQETPHSSLKLISSFNQFKDASIIDIGGGDSNLVDHLLIAGYHNITVLDISKNAIERAKKRLGKDAALVNWIVSDINDFSPVESYDIWHDRASFHFLTEPKEIERYIGIAQKKINGYLALGTFSKDGPLKCSGLEITQYNEEDLTEAFNGFEKLDCFTEDHTTPFDTIQNFTFCSFKKK